MILDNLMNIHDDMLNILEQIDPADIDPEEPVIISWNYVDSPMRFTLLIHENLPEEVDYLESEVIH